MNVRNQVLKRLVKQVSSQNVNISLYINISRHFPIFFGEYLFLFLCLRNCRKIRRTNIEFKTIKSLKKITIYPNCAVSTQLFFQFIYDMYDKTAFILTSNKGP